MVTRMVIMPLVRIECQFGYKEGEISGGGLERGYDDMRP